MLQTIFSHNCLRVAFASAAPALSHISRVLQRSCSYFRSVQGSTSQHASPLTVVFTPEYDAAVTLDPEQQRGSIELLRYRTEFPESMWGHLAGLLQARPCPTAVDMSCAAPGTAGQELEQWGFRVATALPSGLSNSYSRLPSGCSDLVTCLPGPSSMAAGEVLAEARRLMCKGGYLAVAWNDRDLSSPFMSDLESLLESINPDYCRSSKQHNPPAWTHSLTDGGALRLVSFTAHPHGLVMSRCGALQDLMGGLACVRAHLAASSAMRKHFHREVARLVQQHFGDERPFELPLVTKLYVLRKHALASEQQHTTCSIDSEEDEDAAHSMQVHVRTRLTF